MNYQTSANFHNFASRSVTALGALALSAMCFVDQAGAATVNQVLLRAFTCGPENTLTATSEQRLNRNINGGGGGCTYTADGHAGLGMVGVRTTHNATDGPSFEQTGATASAEADFMITAPTGFTGLVPLSVNLSLDGLVTADRTSLIGSAGSSLQAMALVTQDFRTFGRALARIEAKAGAFVASDILSDFERFNGDFKTSEILVDPSMPINLRFRFEGFTELSVGSNTGVPITAFIDGFNTLSLSTSGPAFNLPDSFSVTSTVLNVFDNQWVDARVASPPVSQVPAPASAVLFMTALGLLTCRRRKSPTAFFQ